MKVGARTSPDSLFLLISIAFVGSVEWDLIVKYWLGVKIAEDWIVSLFHYMSGHLFTCLDDTSFLALLLPLHPMFSNLELCLGQCKSYGKFHCCLMFLKPPNKIATGPYIQKSYLQNHHVFRSLVWTSNSCFIPCWGVKPESNLNWVPFSDWRCLIIL